MWEEITYPFANFNGATVEIWEWISNSIPHYQACDYLYMLGLKLNHVIKGQPRKSIWSMTAQTVAIGGIGPMTAHEGANCNSGWILKTQRPSWRQCALPNWFAINDIQFKTDFLPNHVHNTNHTKWVFIMHTNVDSLFNVEIVDFCCFISLRFCRFGETRHGMHSASVVFDSKHRTFRD